MRAFLEAAWALGWVGLVVVIILICLIWSLQDRAMQSLEGRIAKKQAELSEHANCAKDLQAATDERDQLARDLEAARTQVRALQKPVPTGRDKELFARLINEWPWEEGTLSWLRDYFNSKTWSSDTTRQIIYFVDFQGDLHFDDMFVNNALDDFRAACGELVGWLVSESSPGDHDSRIQVVHDGTYRPGGWEEYMEVRDRGIELAQRVVDAWRTFDRVGRSRSL